MSEAVTSTAAIDAFEPERSRLTRIAHRLLGSASEAEDVVQTAWLRWAAADVAAIRSPAAWLTRTVTRIALDILKSAPRRHETYIGEWLPEPIVEDLPGEDDLTTALLLALERLSPLERAAFLLHDVFSVDFNEIARTLDRDAAACRQLAARARRHVAAARPRYPLPAQQQRDMLDAFFAAMHSGDPAALAALLAEDALFISDGGGQRPAVPYPLSGRDLIAKAFAGFARKTDRSGLPPHRLATIDGLPGIVTRESDGLLQTIGLQIGPDGIEAIYVRRNPDKLRHLDH